MASQRPPPPRSTTCNSLAQPCLASQPVPRTCLLQPGRSAGRGARGGVHMRGAGCAGQGAGGGVRGARCCKLLPPKIQLLMSFKESTRSAEFIDKNRVSHSQRDRTTMRETRSEFIGSASRGRGHYDGVTRRGDRIVLWSDRGDGHRNRPVGCDFTELDTKKKCARDNRGNPGASGPRSGRDGSVVAWAWPHPCDT